MTNLSKKLISNRKNGRAGGRRLIFDNPPDTKNYMIADKHWIIEIAEDQELYGILQAMIHQQGGLEGNAAMLRATLIQYGYDIHKAGTIFAMVKAFMQQPGGAEAFKNMIDIELSQNGYTRKDLPVMEIAYHLQIIEEKQKMREGLLKEVKDLAAKPGGIEGNKEAIDKKLNSYKYNPKKAAHAYASIKDFILSEKSTKDNQLLIEQILQQDGFKINDIPILEFAYNMSIKMIKKDISKNNQQLNLANLLANLLELYNEEGNINDNKEIAEIMLNQAGYDVATAGVVFALVNAFMSQTDGEELYGAMIDMELEQNGFKREELPIMKIAHDVHSINETEKLANDPRKGQ